MEKLLGSLGESFLKDDGNYRKLFRPTVDSSNVLPKNLEVYIDAVRKTERGNEDSAKLLKTLFWEMFRYSSGIMSLENYLF